MVMAAVNMGFRVDVEVSDDICFSEVYLPSESVADVAL